MTLTFYNVSDDPRTVNKSLGSAVATVNNVYAKEPLDYLSPTFILTGVTPDAGNYLYCAELNRYYFIKNYVRVFGDKTEVICEIDVRKTYSAALMNTDVIVFNQGKESLADALISDGRLPMQVNTESRTFSFTRGEIGAVNVNNYSFVLNVFSGAGGV